MDALLAKCAPFGLMNDDSVIVDERKLTRLRTSVKLYPHQRFGVTWLARLYEMGCGGILSDEMGLGKTLQSLCFVCWLLERERGIVLVVAPLTVVDNWVSEVERFTTLRCMCYKGDGQTRQG
jgi:SNF2 family DNA or RNA helicase